MHFLLADETNFERRTKWLLIFLTTYGTLFWISSFGVVWYGVAIYFLFLAVIAIALSELSFEPHHDDSEKTFRKNIIAYIFFGLTGIYIFISAFLHSINNLKSAGYNEYKFSTLSQNVSILAYKSEYFPSLLTLNTVDSNAVAV